MDKNMRLKVIFEVSRCIVKNNMMIVSMIKEALKVSSKEYYEKWYEDRVLKDFTFATRANDLTVEDDCFINSNELILVISAYSYETLVVLYNAFLTKKNFYYKGVEVKVKKIFIINEDEIKNNIAIFDTMSPIYIVDKNKRRILFNEDGFERELNYICDVILKEIRGYGLKENVRFKALSMKDVVVRVEFGKFNKDSYFASSKGRFALSADKEDLNALSKTGIGFLRSIGLGCVSQVK